MEHLIVSSYDFYFIGSPFIYVVRDNTRYTSGWTDKTALGHWYMKKSTGMFKKKNKEVSHVKIKSNMVKMLLSFVLPIDTIEHIIPKAVIAVLTVCDFLSYTFKGLKISISISSVQLLSRVQLCDLMDCSTARFPCPLSTAGACSNPCPSSWWCHPTIFSSVVPFSFCFNLSQHQSVFQWVSTSHQVAKVLEFQLQQIVQWIFRLIWSPCSPGDSQESSTPQFKSINSSVLSFLYGPTLISIHDYWKNHSFDLIDLCWRSNVSDFSYAV